jgi:hypothetical protein
MRRQGILGGAVVVLILNLTTVHASACDIVGTWSGIQTPIGRFADQPPRTLTITFRPDCTYDWGGDRGAFRTVGRASLGWSAGSYSYRNEAGSVGTMTVTTQGTRQTMAIVQTQGNYTAQLTKRGR